MFQRALNPTQTSGVSITDTADGLSAIANTGCAAAIWRRQLAPEALDWIDELDPDKLPTTRQILRPDAVRAALLEVCAVSGTPLCAEQAQLMDDITVLADLFAGIMKTPFLRMRLERVTTNACHRFHVDGVTARLICTYRGAGTQYGIAKGNAKPRRVFTAATGAPILLRGTLWQESPRSDLLHRSPPIAGTNETRLLLVLDPVDDGAES